MSSNTTNAGHAIAVLSSVLTSANNERERMAAILDRYHSEFSIERRLRSEAEAENARLLALLDTKSAEVAALSDKSASLEREVKMMVSAIEVAGQQMRDNERMITECIGRITHDFPDDFPVDYAAPVIQADEVGLSPLADPVGDELKEQFSAIENEIIAAINSRGSGNVCGSQSANLGAA